jgi:hypothetical protein
MKKRQPGIAPDNPWICGDVINLFLEREDKKKIVPDYLSGFLKNTEKVGIPIRETINYN